MMTMAKMRIAVQLLFVAAIAVPSSFAFVPSKLRQVQHPIPQSQQLLARLRIYQSPTTRSPLSLLQPRSPLICRASSGDDNKSESDENNDKRTDNNDSQQESSPSDKDVSAANNEDGTTSTNATNNANDNNVVPSYGKLLAFCATTVLIWISEPLLSLVDTTVVSLTQGRKAGIIQVAALGPATTLMDSLQYLTYFLAMATTSQMGKYLALKDYRRLQTTCSQILGVAAVLGGIISISLWLHGGVMLGRMIGGDCLRSTPALLTHSLKYCWIRALVTPLAVMGMVAEASCLAHVDTKTPAIAVVVGALVNLVGDVLLSPRFGILGAAVATAAATATATAIMLLKVKQRKAVWRQQELASQTYNGATTMPSVMNGLQVSGAGVAGMTAVVNGTPILLPRNANTTASNGNAEKKSDKQQQQQPQGENARDEEEQKAIEEICRKHRLPSPRVMELEKQRRAAKKAAASDEVPFLSLPDRKSFMSLVRLSGPMFFVMLGKIACYSAMSVQATRYGVDNLAAHSIMMRVFFFFTCFGDSLGQAAQSFIPRAIYPTPNKQNVRKMLQRLMIFATLVGVFISQSSSLMLQHGGKFLTTDASIAKTIATHAPYVLGSLWLHPFILMFEGAIIAMRDLRHLVVSYSIAMVLHFGLLKYACHSFADVWKVLLLFQLCRTVLFGSRIFQRFVWKNRRKRQPRAEEGLAASA